MRLTKKSRPQGRGRGSKGGFKRLKSESGVALILALLVTALMAAVVVEMIYEVHISTASVTMYSEGQEASIAAEGGIELAGTVLSSMRDAQGYVSFGGEYYIEQTLSEGRKTIRLRAEDESAKVPINIIVGSNGSKNGWYYGIYLRLLRELELDESLAETLADWLDADDEPRPLGAESVDHYMNLNPGYASRDGRLKSLEELLLVKGYTPEVFRKLAPYVTIYTMGPINLNTAQKPLLQALSEDMTESMVDELMEYRLTEPLKHASKLTEVPGFSSAVSASLQIFTGTTSMTYRVVSRATVGESVREAETVIKGQKLLYWRER